MYLCDLYKSVFIHIHLYYEKNFKTHQKHLFVLFCLVADLFNHAQDGDGGTILGPLMTTNICFLTKNQCPWNGTY